MATRNDVTGDKLVSKANTKEYEDNWDRIFGKKEYQESWDRLYSAKKGLHESNWPEVDFDEMFDEDRIDVIGQNGPTGEHYDE